jgi:hypothetical protein
MYPRTLYVMRGGTRAIDEPVQEIHIYMISPRDPHTLRGAHTPMFNPNEHPEEQKKCSRYSY